MNVRYYMTPAGRSPVEEFVLSLLESTRLEVFDAINRLDSGNSLEMPLSRNLSSIQSGLHELRFRDKAGQVRVVYFVKKQVAVYLVHGFWKKTQEIPRKELKVILKRLRRFEPMPWKEVTLRQFAKALGANVSEVREKQRLIDVIVKIRKAQKLSQAALAKKIGVSQARIAQVESGIGTARISFDVLFNILVALGYDYRVITTRAA